MASVYAGILLKYEITEILLKILQKYFPNLKNTRIGERYNAAPRMVLT